MTMSIMMATLASSFLLLPTMKTPMMMTLMIILISLLLALMFSMSMSSWYAFLIFLIYVSGMLVMFSYFTATSPNQSALHIKSTTLALATLIIAITPVMMNINAPTIYMNSLQLTNMYSAQNMFMLIMITLILLFTMVIIVKLTTRSKGPMRPFK